MTLILLLSAVLADSTQARIQLEKSLAGPPCSHATMQLTQAAQIGTMWEDRERFQLQGSLRNGTWEDLQAILLEDMDPDTPLEEGSFPYIRPGIGEVPGDPDTSIWEEGLPAGKALGPAWVWSTPDYTLSWQAERVSLSAPKRVKSKDGSVENMEWFVKLDPEGLPVREEGSLRAKQGAFTIDVQWHIEYVWRPC